MTLDIVAWPPDVDLWWHVREMQHSAWRDVEHGAAKRRRETWASPLRFALTYFPHLLKRKSDGTTSFSTLHIDMCQAADRWIDYGPIREAWIAPRDFGKSTWPIILTVWALAHGHREYLMAFAAVEKQARQKLDNIRRQLAGETPGGRLLLNDFPNLRPQTRRNSQSTVVLAGGQTLEAAGIDSTRLGANSGGKRPDLFILDDLEPAGAWSDTVKEQLLDKILNAVLPMNEDGVVQLVGTATRYGGIVHDLVTLALRPAEAPAWTTAARFTPRYYPAIVAGPDGEESLWPEKRSIEWLRRERQAGRELAAQGRVDSYAVNYDNDPPRPGGKLWGPELFRRRALPTGQGLFGRLALSMDVATSLESTSDYTALTVGGTIKAEPGAVEMMYARRGKGDLEVLRRWVESVLAAYPAIRDVLVETNHGGDAWERLLSDMCAERGVRLHPYRARGNKDVRIAELHRQYVLGLVYHSEELKELEDEEYVHPRNTHDDVVDSAAALVAWLQDPGSCWCVRCAR